MQLLQRNQFRKWGDSIVLLGLLLLTSACSSTPAQQGETNASAGGSADQAYADSACAGKFNYAMFLAANGESADGEVIKVRATGYGAPPKKYYPNYQRRLMAMRASRIDAYRALAENINGIHIMGGTTVGEMIVRHDSYRVFVDGFITGANTVEVKEHEDSSYETTLETVMDRAFYQAVLAHQGKTNCDPNTGQGSIAMQNKDSRANNFYYSE